MLTIDVLQGAGKSSMITAVTDIPYFPVGNRLTTKAPIRLNLKPLLDGAQPKFSIRFRGLDYSRHINDEADISAILQHIMEKEIPEGKLTFEEITVCVQKPGVQSLVIIDTPGIREDDPRSRECVRKYLQSEGYLVLCLVEAAHVSLASHAAVALVQAAGKGGDARVVLNRVDEVVSSNVEDRVLSRIVGEDEHMQAAGIASAHAVISAMPADASAQFGSLDDYERQHFQQHIFPKLSQHDAPSKKRREQVMEQCTMRQLVTHLVPWFDDHVRNKVVPITKKWLQPKIREAEHALTLLGPEHLTVRQVLEAVAAECDFQKVIDFLHQGSSNHGADGAPQAILPPILLGSDGQQIMAEYEPAQIEPPALAYYTQQANLAHAAYEGIRSWLEQHCYMSLLKAMIREAFAAESALQLHRFDSLLTAVLEYGLTAAINPAAVTEKIMQIPVLQQLRDLQLSPARDLSRPGALAELDADVRTALIYQVVIPLVHGGALLDCIGEDFIPEESADYKEKRGQAELHLERLNCANRILKDISCMPAAPAQPYQPQVRSKLHAHCMPIATRPVNNGCYCHAAKKAACCCPGSVHCCACFLPDFLGDRKASPS